MTSADSREIENLFEPVTGNDIDLSQYTDSQRLFIQDNNQGSYTSGQIQFFCTALRNTFVVWRDCSLVIPLQITSGTDTALSAATLLSFKQSITDLISGIQIVSEDGVQIVSENSNQTVPINRIRQLINHDLDWLTQEGASLMFVEDISALPTGTVGIVQPTVVVGTNPGYSQRVSLLKQQIQPGSTTTWQTTVSIPLRYLHSFYDALDYPIFNTAFNLTFYTNLKAGGDGSSTWQPFTIDPIAYAAGVTSLTAVIAPNMPVPGASAASYSVGTCRLYYNAVSFPNHIAKEIETRMASPGGFRKRTYFTLTDYYPPLSSEINSTANGNRILSSNTIFPERIWVLAFPNATQGVTAASQMQTLFNPSSGLTQLNCKINNAQVYNQNLITTYDQYEILKEQMPKWGEGDTSGGIISYDKFLSTYRLHCIDLSRLKGAQTNPFEGSSIEIDFVPMLAGAGAGAAVPSDYHYLVEKRWVVDWNFTPGKVTITMGNVQRL